MCTSTRACGTSMGTGPGVEQAIHKKRQHSAPALGLRAHLSSTVSTATNPHRSPRAAGRRTQVAGRAVTGASHQMETSERRVCAYPTPVIWKQVSSWHCRGTPVIIHAATQSNRLQSTYVWFGLWNLVRLTARLGSLRAPPGTLRGVRQRMKPAISSPSVANLGPDSRLQPSIARRSHSIQQRPASRTASCPTRPR